MHTRIVTTALAVVLATTSMLIAVAPAASATYITTKPVLELTPDAERASTVADAAGALHTVFRRVKDAGVFYGTNKTGTWVFQKLTSTLATDRPAIAVDGQARAYVVFSNDGATPGLRYLTNRSGAWVGQRMTTAAEDRNPAITTDSLGEVHIVYDKAGSIRYLTNRRGYWSARTVADGGSRPSIALDTERRVHIAMESGESVRYVTDRSGAWVNTHVAWDGYLASIAVRGTTPSIAYSGLTGGVFFATKGTSWTVAKVATPSMEFDEGPSLRIDGTGKAHLAYAGGYPRTVEYATNASGSWVKAAVGAGSWPAMVLGAGGVKHFTFTSTSLFLRSSDLPSWTAGLASSSTEDLQPAIAIAPDGTPRTAYRVAGASPGIRVGVWNGSGFTATRITYELDREPALVVDATGVRHLAFVRETSPRGLWYGTDDGGTWAFTKVDESSTIACPAIALGQDGHVHIAAFREHSDAGYIFPRVAWYTDATGSWAMRNDLPIVTWPECPGLAVDADDEPHLAYGNGTAIAYAQLVGADWTSSTFGGGYDHLARIAMASDGTVAISYGHLDPYDYSVSIHVRTIDGDTIETDVVGATENQPYGFAMDASGSVHLAYPGRWGVGILYASNETGTWRVQRVLDQGVSGATLAVTPAGVAEILYRQPAAGGGLAAGLIHVRE